MVNHKTAGAAEERGQQLKYPWCPTVHEKLLPFRVGSNNKGWASKGRPLVFKIYSWLTPGVPLGDTLRIVTAIQ